MWKALSLAFALMIAGCAQIPPSPQQIEDQKMEPVAGKAVVYIVQNPFGDYDAGLTFDDGTQITTWPGTFYRWVTIPGTHTIKSSEGNLSAFISLQVEAGKIYYVQHYVTGIRGSTTDASLREISARDGRELVTSGTLCCNVS
ncbi:MAG: DUF2846 domain-containing protein [Betaproteobacteria bacterium]|nr:DUF2846 domain-containing protein [Betaproteobacteria bacterium]MDH3436204.1 DUF2846 domain-containing protein [Betaproteobacteria bacterium]